MKTTTAVALCACASVVPSVQSSLASFDWSRTRTWLQVGAYSPFTDAQAKFLATHYDIIGLGGTFGGPPHSGEEYQASTARLLKRYSNTTKVLTYRNTALSLYGQLQSNIVFEAHPEWWLRDKNGQVIAQGQTKYIDHTVPEAREWFVSSLVNAVHNASGAFDGAFADGAGDEDLFGQLTPEKQAALNETHAMTVQNLTASLHEIDPQFMTLGNGALMIYRNDPSGGVHYLQNHDIDGACAEHFGSFECVNMTSQNYDGVAMEQWVDVISRASIAVEGTDRPIIIKSWPGPATGPLTATGPTWPNQTNWTMSQRRAASAAAFDWAFAAYLLVASPNTYMSYGWWYQLPTGYVPCPDDPMTCSCPDDWYPDLLKPTGAPTTPATKVPDTGSGHVWQREFEHVSVRVDLGDFADVSLTWK